MTAEPGRRRDAVIIGAGHNGLVAGCYLARAGLDVTVLEAAPHIGGMTITLPTLEEAPEHRFNLCAVDLIFLRMTTIVADLELRRHGLREVDADPGYAYLEPDGASLVMWRDPQRMAAEIARFSRKDAAAYLRMAATFDAAAAIAMPTFAMNPMRPDARSVAAAGREALRNLRRLPGLAAMMARPACDVIAERFEHPTVRMALDFLVSVVGPNHVRGSAAWLMFMGFHDRIGASRPLGGMGELPASLARCLAEAGGELRTSAPVHSLLTSNGRVHGVQLEDGQELLARTVIASGDPRRTLTELLAPDDLPPRTRKRAEAIPTTNDGVLFLKVDIACHGRVQMANHLRSDGVDLRAPLCRMGGTLEATTEAQKLAAQGIMPPYIPMAALVPNVLDPSLTPDGQDSVYVYAWGLPQHPGQDWSVLKHEVAQRLTKELGVYYTNLDEIEIARSVESCDDMAARTRTSGGSPYVVDMALSRMGPARPALGLGGYRTPIEGLFLSGGGTHPGPGVSGLPGQLAAREVLRTLRRGGLG